MLGGRRFQYFPSASFFKIMRKAILVLAVCFNVAALSCGLPNPSIRSSIHYPIYQSLGNTTLDVGYMQGNIRYQYPSTCSILWSTGETTPTIQMSLEHTGHFYFWCQVTDSEGCVSWTEIFIVVYPKYKLPFINIGGLIMRHS